MTDDGEGGDDGALLRRGLEPEFVRGYQAGWYDSFKALEQAGIAHIDDEGNPVIHATNYSRLSRIRFWRKVQVFFFGGWVFSMLILLLNNYPDRWAYSWI